MSRSLLVVIVVVVALIGGIILLSTMDTNVPPTRVEKPVLNEAAPQ